MRRSGYGADLPGFSDVAEGSASYEAIKLCYEQGLMNGTSETTFSPQGKLNIAQLVVLAARLYDLQNGGDGTVPDLPDYGQPYLRFYDEDGNKIIFFSMEEIPAYHTAGEGVKEPHQSASGTMNQGYVGTGYRFSDPDAASFTKFVSFPMHLEDAWWYPAAFYLASEGKLSLDGDLIFRASGGDIQGYDAENRFSSDNAARALFAWLVDRTAGELEVLNETVNVPDVDPYETQDAEAILRLYQAGILTGVDQAGNFNGSGELTRGEAAIMLARVLDPASRVKLP